MDERLGASADRAHGVADAAPAEQEWRQAAELHAGKIAASAQDRAEVDAAIRDVLGE